MKETSRTARRHVEEFLHAASVLPRTDGTNCRFTVAQVMAHAGIATVAEFARRAEVSRRTIYRWINSGLDDYTADRLAIKVAHSHPSLVFGPSWFASAIPDEELVA